MVELKQLDCLLHLQRENQLLTELLLLSEFERHQAPRGPGHQ